MTGSPDDGTVLSRLSVLFPESSGRRLRQWLSAGRVRVNSRVIRDGRTSVAPRDAVTLSPHGEPRFPEPLRLLHEDEHLLVIDKPSGLLTIATERERHRTAYRLLWEYLHAQHPPRRPFVVHRLDRETSGLLVVAKSPAAKRLLQTQFEGRTVERVYVAVVEGLVHADAGTLESALVQDRTLRVRSARKDRGDSRGGTTARRAVTHYRVRERRRNATLLELSLNTGRRRQIRIQLAELGHPVIGDVALGSRRSPIRRLCLHATRLGFRHPATRTPMRFESPPPAGFDRVGR